MQTEVSMNPDGALVGFLRTLAGPGLNAVVGAVLSLILEFWPAYGATSPRVKRFVAMGLCLVLPVVATVALAMGLGSVPTADDVFLALQAGFTAFFAGQGVHGLMLRGSGTINR
jgi:hypothetical protein